MASLLNNRLSARLLIVNRQVKIRKYSSAAPAVAATSTSEGDLSNEVPSSSVPTKDRKISPRINDLVEQIATLSLLEVSDLNYALKKRLNIPDTPFMSPGVMKMPAAAKPAATSGEEKEKKKSPVSNKTSFAVKLTKFDDSKKIALIKEIRNHMPGMNLVQAKKFVETAPIEVKADLGKNEADELKAALEKVGAVCEVI